MAEVLLPNGVRLHWREAGDPAKPPVVWIHGGSVEDSSFMVADLEPFFARVRALFPDTRGHGLSSPFERVEDYGYAQKAEDVLLWLDALGVERAVWGGASMGAPCRCGRPSTRRTRVRAVISISGPPYEPPAEDKAWWRAHRPLVEAGRVAEYFDANVRLRMGETRPGPVQGASRALRGDDRATAPPLHRVAAGAARRDLLAARVARRLRAHPLPGARRRRQRGPLPDGRDVPAGGGDHPRRAPARRSRRRRTFPIARTGPRSRR